MNLKSEMSTDFDSNEKGKCPYCYALVDFTEINLVSNNDMPFVEKSWKCTECSTEGIELHEINLILNADDSIGISDSSFKTHILYNRTYDGYEEFNVSDYIIDEDESKEDKWMKHFDDFDIKIERAEKDDGVKWLAEGEYRKPGNPLMGYSKGMTLLGGGDTPLKAFKELMEAIEMAIDASKEEE